MFCRLANAALRSPLRFFSLNSPASSLSPTTSSSSNAKLSRLANGLRVFTEATSPLHRTATIGIMINRGSRDESRESNGVAHFLEHLAFKGTSTRSKSQIESEAEDHAVQLNAYTTREQTAFYAHCLTENLPKAIDLVSDILLNSKLDKVDLENERSVILREQEEVEANIMEFLLDHLHSIAFQGSPLANTILGPASNIKSIQRHQILEYVHNNYRAENMVFSAVGGQINHEAVLKAVESKLSSLLPSGNLGNDINSDDTLKDQDYPKESSESRDKVSNFIGSDLQMRDDKMQVCHSVFAVEGVPWLDDRIYSLLVATVLLGSYERGACVSAQGGNLTSYFARECDSEQIINLFQAFNTQYRDTGLFGMYFTSSRMTCDKAVKRVTRELHRLATCPTPLELERGKQLLKTQYLLSLDGTQQLFDEVSRQILYAGRRVSFEEFATKIDQLSLSDFKEDMFDIVMNRDISCVSLGPVELFPDYNLLVANMHSLLS